MKKFLVIMVLALLSGCTTRTEYGQCVGVIEDRDPKLVYKLSIWNTVLAIVFSETIFVPIVVLANSTLCPEGTK